MGKGVRDDGGGRATGATSQTPGAVLGGDFDREAGPLAGGVELAPGFEAREARHGIGDFDFGGPSLAPGPTFRREGSRGR